MHFNFLGASNSPFGFTQSFFSADNDNPVFSISLVNATDLMQQPIVFPRKDNVSNYLSDLTYNSRVIGKKEGKIINGVVSRIYKNEQGDVTLVEIRDEIGKLFKIEATNIEVLDNSAYDDIAGTVFRNISVNSTIIGESKLINFEDFK